jgi:hypothetical protein
MVLDFGYSQESVLTRSACYNCTVEETVFSLLEIRRQRTTTETYRTGKIASQKIQEYVGQLKISDIENSFENRKQTEKSTDDSDCDFFNDRAVLRLATDLRVPDYTTGLSH